SFDPRGRRDPGNQKSIETVHHSTGTRIGSARSDLATAVVGRNPTSRRNAIVFGFTEKPRGCGGQLSVLVFRSHFINLHLVLTSDRRISGAAEMRLKKRGLIRHVARRKLCRQNLTVVIYDRSELIDGA